MNKMIDPTQEKALQVMYKDKSSDLDTLLHKDNSETIHVQNLQLLMIEIFKSINNSNSTFMIPFSYRKTAILTKNVSRFRLTKVETKVFGIEIVSFLRCRLWNTLPN